MEMDLGHWLAGLIDGEGSFFIYRDGGVWTTGFSLRLRADDRSTLELAQEAAGLGRVYLHRSTASANRPNNRPSVTWQVNRRTEKLGLVQLLEQFPLRSKKAADFLIWKQAVLFGANELLASRLRAARQYDASTHDPQPLVLPASI